MNGEAVATFITPSGHHIVLALVSDGPRVWDILVWDYRIFEASDGQHEEGDAL
jgi:hypothetical protein